MSFEQIAAGLEDVDARGDALIAGQQFMADTAPFGSELLTRLDDETAAYLGEAACINSDWTKVDDVSSFQEEFHLGLHDPGETVPAEINSIF